MKLFALGVLTVVAVACSPVRVRSNRAASTPPVTTSPTTSTTVDTTTTVPDTTTSLDTTTSSLDTTVPPTTVVSTPPLTAAEPQPTHSSAGSGFEQCVITRESGGDPHVGSGGLYGILPSTWHSLGRRGTAGDASPGEQRQAYLELYEKYGKQPWSNFDGCR